MKAELIAFLLMLCHRMVQFVFGFCAFIVSVWLFQKGRRSSLWWFGFLVFFLSYLMRLMF